MIHIQPRYRPDSKQQRALERWLKTHRVFILNETASQYTVFVPSTQTLLELTCDFEMVIERRGDEVNVYLSYTGEE